MVAVTAGHPGRRDTLTAIEGSRLSQMFGGRWDKVLPKDKSGRFFLDLDPQQFRALLSWLVDVKRTPPGSLEETEPPVESLPEEFRPGFLDLCRLLCSRDDLESESKKAEEEDTAAFSETLKTLREALDSTIKQGKMEMDESHADLVEKVMAVAQAALDYECTTRRQNRVLDAQQKAVDIEVGGGSKVLFYNVRSVKEEVGVFVVSYRILYYYISKGIHQIRHPRERYMTQTSTCLAAR